MSTFLTSILLQVFCYPLQNAKPFEWNSIHRFFVEVQIPWLLQALQAPARKAGQNGKDGQLWIKYEEYKFIESLLSRYVKCFWRKNSISLFPLVSLNHWFIMIFFSGKHLLVVPNLLCHISSSSVIVRLWLVMSF